MRRDGEIQEQDENFQVGYSADLNVISLKDKSL